MPTVKQEAQTSKIQDDLETSITLFERKAAILFGVIASVVTFGLILWYWIEVFRLTVHSLLYWTCTMCIFYQLFRLYAGIMWLYRRLRGLNLGNILKETEEYVQDFTLFVPRMWGFQLGQGPLFELLPEEWKAARRACKSPEEVSAFLAFAAGPVQDDIVDPGVPDEAVHHVWNEDHDTERLVNPCDVEYGPNPVIHAHLRGEYMQPQTPPSTMATQTSTHSLEQHTETSLEYQTNFDHDQNIQGTFDGCDQVLSVQDPPTQVAHNGPVTKLAELSSFQCDECPLVFQKAFQRSKHVNQVHAHRYKCSHNGCAKTFGLRTNLERHEKTHSTIAASVDEVGLECPNLWCKTPKKVFARKDNFDRHFKRCFASGFD